jgi:molybdopterin/thiamine biosynthesis adenylyltransferase
LDTISPGELFARHDPVKGSVLIIGAGAVGGFLADELAAMGITQLRIVDFDTLAIPNLIRHPLPRTMIGQPKASSLATHIRGKFPTCNAVGIDRNFLDLSDDDQLQMVRQADVVVAAIDPEDCRRRINELCVEAEVPAVYTAVWVSEDVTDAEVGEIFWTLPGRHTPCYACWLASDRSGADDDSGGTGHGMRADIKVVVLAAASVVRALVGPTPERVRILDRTRNLILVHSFTPTSTAVERLFHGPNFQELSRSTRSGFRSRNVAVSFPPIPCQVCGGQAPPDPEEERRREERARRERVDAARHEAEVVQRLAQQEAEAAEVARRDAFRKLHGVAALRDVGASLGQQEREREIERVRIEAAKMARTQRRDLLWDNARQEFEPISATLREAVLSAGAPVQITPEGPSHSRTQQSWNQWEITLGGAGLRVRKLGRLLSFGSEPNSGNYGDDWLSNTRSPFDIVAYSYVEVNGPRNSQGYIGRSHSLWFGDVQDRGNYGWYEVAFEETRHQHIPIWQWNPASRSFSSREGIYLPHERPPQAVGAVAAFGPEPVGLKVIWPPTPLAAIGLDDFINRWVGWFAAAAQGQLYKPSGIPERDLAGAWRIDGI